MWFAMCEIEVFGTGIFIYLAYYKYWLETIKASFSNNLILICSFASLHLLTLSDDFKVKFIKGENLIKCAKEGKTKCTQWIRCQITDDAKMIWNRTDQTILLFTQN